MTTINRPPTGSFCWAELGTNDVQAAAGFYAALLTWTRHDVSEGAMQYAIFQLGGVDAAGLYHLMPDQVQAGVPPHWLIYVSVDDADASAAKAVELGATVLAGPANAMDAGRFAILRDPQGAVFAIWQPMRHVGSKVDSLNYRHCWSELGTTDAAGALEFYTKLFGWTVLKQDMTPQFTYHTWVNQGMPGGGMYQLTPDMAGVPPHWMPYFSVPDCDAAAATATARGGMVRVPPSDIPNVGRFSVLTDPQGAVFSVIHLTMPAPAAG